MKPISILVPFKVVDSQLKVWVQRRDSDDKLKGLWEFPGGKIELEESPQQACVREVKEEVGVDLDEEQLLRFNHYHFDSLVLFVFCLEDKHRQFSEAGYVPLENLGSDNYQVLPNNLKILEDLHSRFQDVS